MKFLEALEMLRTLPRVPSTKLEERPKLVIFDAEKEGYTLWINQKSVKSDYLSLLEKVAETRNLEIKKYKGYFIVGSNYFQ